MEERDPRDDWQGLLKELERLPGAEVHAIYTRLCECVPFFTAAIESADGMAQDALMHLENFLHGTRG